LSDEISTELNLYPLWINKNQEKELDLNIRRIKIHLLTFKFLFCKKVLESRAIIFNRHDLKIRAQGMLFLPQKVSI